MGSPGESKGRKTDCVCERNNYLITQIKRKEFENRKGVGG